MEIKVLSQGGQNFDTHSYSYHTQNISADVKYEGSNSNLKIFPTNNTVSINEVQNTTVNEDNVKEVVDKLNKVFEGTPTHVEYETVGKSKHLLIKIVDTATKEIVQELPPKKIVEMIDRLCELAGIMVDKKA